LTKSKQYYTPVSREYPLRVIQKQTCAYLFARHFYIFGSVVW